MVHHKPKSFVLRKDQKVVQGLRVHPSRAWKPQSAARHHCPEFPTHNVHEKIYSGRCKMQIRRAELVATGKYRKPNIAYPRKNPSQTKINEGWVSSRSGGEREDSEKNREEHMCPSNFEEEVEDEDAVCASANVG